MTFPFERNRSFAQKLDADDPLQDFRNEFLFPKTKDGKEVLYFCGNSLGLEPKRTRDYILQELQDWQDLGVLGHFNAKHPWYPYHEFVTEGLAHVMGAKPHEVVAMNTLTTNLHLLMVSFYQPKGKRNKILIENGAFPSDIYAVSSQIRFHGFDPKECLLECDIEENPTEAVETMLQKHRDEIALVLLGNVNFRSGQAFRMKRLTEKAHEIGAHIGFDLAHGAGNLECTLHDQGPDFAAWCSYKYLNSGPGGIAGVFVHDRHQDKPQLPRFEGWWGHDKNQRFDMEKKFMPMKGAEAWQLSNPPIFQLAALRASLEIFLEAKMNRLVEKRRKISSFLYDLCADLPFIEIITPKDPEDRGAQISMRIQKDAKKLVTHFENQGIVCDVRPPDIIRVAPTPLYNRYEDVYLFYEALKEYVEKS